MQIRSTWRTWSNLRVRFHENCLWWLREHEHKWDTGCDPVDICIVSEREDVGVKFQVLVALFIIVLKPGYDDAVVPLDMNIGSRVVLYRENNFNAQDLADELKEPWSELLPIVRKESSRWAVGHDSMSYKGFFHILGCGMSELNSADEIREPILYNQKVFASPRGCAEFPQDVHGDELQCSASRKDLHRLIVSAEICAVSGTQDAVSYCRVTVHGHRRAVEQPAEEMVQ